MTLHREAYGTACQLLLDALLHAARLGQGVRMLRAAVHPRLHLITSGGSRIGHRVEIQLVGQRRQTVAHTQIALHRTLGIRLRQTLRHCAVDRRLTVRHRVDVRRGAANVDSQQIAHTGLLARAFAEEFAAVHHRQWRRDDAVRRHFLHTRQPLGLDDATDEEFLDLLLRRRNVEPIKLRHHIVRDHIVLVRRRKDLLQLVRGRLVASHDDGEVPIDGAEASGIGHDHLLVAAVCATAEQHQVGVDAVDLVLLLLRNLKGVRLHHLGASAGGRQTGRLGCQLRHQP